MLIFIDDLLRILVKFLDLYAIYLLMMYLFVFDGSCLVAFEKIKQLLTLSPIIQPPNWSLLFELMCDASDYAVGVVLG